MGDAASKQGIPDALFMRVAVERRFAKLGELRECLSILRDKEGESLPLPMVMLRQGLLTRDDIDAIEAIGRSGEVVPRTIERYEIVTKIGEGGMGSVFAVVDPASMELCAVKVLPDELAEDEDLVKRFQREGETACGLRHPNIVGGLRVVEHEGQHFFAMEFVDGETVYDRLERDGVFPEPEALKIVRGICLGLQYAEEKGLVHRDIKPENIMMDRDGTAKLLDMGLVKRLDAGRVSRLTQSGMAIGTPHYISPEQARGEENVDHRSDIYALGATLYHMLTGKVPFEGNTAAVIMTKHLTEELDWPSDINPEISENTSRLISKMMAKERRDRYQHGRDAVADLDLILSGRAPSGELLPPGASSIRQAVKIARARERAAERERERTRKHVTAVHERISKRRRHVLVELILQNKQVATYVGAAIGGLLLIMIIAALASRRDADEEETPVLPPTPVSPLVVPDRLEQILVRLRDAPIERIPDVIAGLPDQRTLGPAAAERLADAKALAMSRFDEEAERRLNALLAATLQEERSEEQTLADLRNLRATFAASRVRPRIEQAIAALEISDVPAAAMRTPAAAPALEAREAHQEFGTIDLIGPGRLVGWRRYGDWKAEGGALTFSYDEGAKYSNSIQSLLGVGECTLTAEIKTTGGTRAAIVLWEQGTEDEGSGAPDSSVSVVITGDGLAPATRDWTRLHILALADEVKATFGGKEIEARPSGPLRHGRIGISLDGGEWSVRSLEVTPLLIKGEAAYEATFDDGGGRDWSGKRVTSGLAAVTKPASRHKWAELLGGQDVFDITEGMRLGFAYRADHVSGLVARVMVKGGEIYRFRLSGRPPARKWTALTIPMSNFHNEEGASPPAGTTVRSIGIGAEGPADASLVVSVLRLVP